MEELVNNNFVVKPIEKVLHDSMLPYSEYVILDRALPRVEDGLKPVQRRVLYSMLEVGVLPDRPHRKSARIVGDCLGKYHPHGDRSIYDTMVRMAQDFNMSEVLVDGYGNFGSVDGDSAAAMRYTEARLAPISLELLRDIEKDTVKWSFNFDDTRKEPDMLPGRFPNLLVNGSTGIAVGLATNVPTHNLGEVIDGVVAYIDNPNITLEQLMEYIPAPDFPTGGYLLKSSEFYKAYSTGKGRLVLQAKVTVEKDENGKKNLVITEIPYGVNKSQLLQKIARVKDEDTTGLLSPIYEIVDESDRQGIRAVIKLKKDANVEGILAMLYKTTELQSSFNVNMVAIADGKPKLMSLLDIIKYYVNYQQQVIFRRTKFDLEAALKKEHILDGLYIAICNIDEVVKIIKTSKSVTDAKENLMSRFKLTDVQAQAILDMKLARLTSLEIDKLVEELKRLKELIREYTKIIKSPQMQMDIVRKEILDIKERFNRPRRTQIVDDGHGVVEVSSIKIDKTEELYVMFTSADTVKAMPKKNYNMADKEITESTATYNIPSVMIRCLSSDKLVVFTNLGNVYKVPVSAIAQCKYKDKGAKISSVIKQFVSTEHVICVYKEEEITKSNVIMITKQGNIKISAGLEYDLTKSSAIGIKLKDDDQLISVFNKLGDRIIIVTKDGNVLNIDGQDVSLSGRVSMGVKAIALDDYDYVVGASMISKDKSIAILTNNGLAKNVMLSDIPESARNRKGVKIMPLKGSQKIIYAGTNNFVAVSEGRILPTNLDTLPLTNRLNAGKSISANKLGVEVKEVYPYSI